jgi:hypothetical protein
MVDDDDRLICCLKLFLTVREASEIRDERLDDIIGYKASEKYGESIFQECTIKTKDLNSVHTNPLVSKVIVAN